MQISRHWRMNSQRYRLVGVRYQNGEVSLQTRPTLPSSEAPLNVEHRTTIHARMPIALPVGK